MNGLLATMTIPEPTDGDVFLAYLEQVLCPRLRPGQVVIMDNLSAHKHRQVRMLIEQAGAELLYLPTYSPDFNPIEKCWSKDQTTLTSKQSSNTRHPRPRHHSRHGSYHHPRFRGLVSILRLSDTDTVKPR
jgi:hypothetical protein